MRSTFLVLVLAILGCKQRSDEKLAAQKVDLAKLVVKKFAFEAYPLWARVNVDKSCPDKLEDLGEFMDKQFIDPWGKPYKMMCGPTLPAEARGLAVSSSGPDGTEGTSDDIKSWE